MPAVLAMKHAPGERVLIDGVVTDIAWAGGSYLVIPSGIDFGIPSSVVCTRAEFDALRPAPPRALSEERVREVADGLAGEMCALARPITREAAASHLRFVLRGILREAGVELARAALSRKEGAGDE